MPAPQVIPLEPQALSEKLADIIVKAQDDALAKGDRFDIAISGGSLASTMAKGLLNRSGVKWNKWVVWLADERIVPITDEDSNMRLFKEQVCEKLPAGESPTLQFLDETLDFKSSPTAQFASNYEQRLKSELGSSPVIDLVLLGMGPDGHTCSLFPGHPLLQESKLLVAPIDDSPKPPPRRITLTKPALAAAKGLCFVATGAGKNDAMKQIFGSGKSQLPSAQVNELSSAPVVWLVDAAAVKDVQL